ncbi:MAG: transglutaminase domain-containing protein [Clostridia bacterium]|nr:transglutaminase domain-containing protein [Clostridia bacterium]
MDGRKRTAAALLAAALVLLTGCAARPAQTDAPDARTQAAEEASQSQTWTFPAETDDPDANDPALPQERTQTQPQTEQTPDAPTTAAPTTAAPTTTAPTTAATTTAAPTTAQTILNSAPLNPQKTNDAELDDAVQRVFERIFTPGMTTYDKVVACYNYIINNTEYGGSYMTVTQDDLTAYQQEQDMWIVLFSKRLLENGKGVCDDYSALFLVMTRAIGLDCYYTHGYTTNTKGETKGHVWDTITVGGVDYIFDPQVEDKQSANGIKYTFFCQPYDSSIAKIYSGYDLAADKAAYNAFRQ